MRAAKVGNKRRTLVRRMGSPCRSGRGVLLEWCWLGTKVDNEGRAGCQAEA